MKRLIVDLDDTISKTSNGDYLNSVPNMELVAKLSEYKKEGFEIIINSSRNMRTHSGNIGKINVHTLPIIIDWLTKNNIPFDEVYIGKPWCGFDGFYIDDRAIRPSEFLKYSYEEICSIIKNEKL